MNKRSYLIAILSKLEKEWLPAWWLRIIAEEWKLSDEIIDIFIQIIQVSLDEISTDELKSKLDTSIIMLEKVKKLEEESKQHDQEDLDELDQLLETM